MYNTDTWTLAQSYKLCTVIKDTYVHMCVTDTMLTSNKKRSIRKRTVIGEITYDHRHRRS